VGRTFPRLATHRVSTASTSQLAKSRHTVPFTQIRYDQKGRAPDKGLRALTRHKNRLDCSSAPFTPHQEQAYYERNRSEVDGEKSYQGTLFHAGYLLSSFTLECSSYK
jgi:hypothetical protein